MRARRSELTSIALVARDIGAEDGGLGLLTELCLRCPKAPMGAILSDVTTPTASLATN
jgi:hypothetical protein